METSLQKYWDEGVPADLTMFWERPEFYRASGRYHAPSRFFVYYSKDELRSFVANDVEGYEGRRMAIMGTDSIIGVIIVRPKQ